jgi:hypothetical protein
MTAVVACYVDPSRQKADGWMRDFAKGCDGRLIIGAHRDPEATDHVVCGNWPVATALIEEFKRDGAKFWYLDSSYLQGARQSYLRVERGRFWPEITPGAHTIERASKMGIQLVPWRKGGSHVLICLHGEKFGKPWGIDIVQWNAGIVGRVRAMTDRPIIVRPKLMEYPVPLAAQLRHAWCVVTHSSTAAVQAVLAGVPVFCEPTCAAASVGCTDLSLIETPVRPDREPWLAELAWQQWSHIEMRSGWAWAYLKEKT